MASDTQTECRECQGTGWKTVDNPKAPGMRLAVACPHAVREDIRRKLSKIGPRDRWAQIELLEICEDPTRCFAPIELQHQIIKRLRADPDRSFAFFGPSGFGKTSYIAALWHRAVTQSEGRGCYYVQMCDLVRSLRNYEFDRDETPELSRQIIRDAVSMGRRPRVFIDEFDKVTASEFARNAIHDFIDELYKQSDGTPHGVQLVLGTNLDRDEFVQIWGANVLRRIEAVCEIFDFFEAIAALTANNRESSESAPGSVPAKESANHAAF